MTHPLRGFIHFDSFTLTLFLFFANFAQNCCCLFVDARASAVYDKVHAVYIMFQIAEMIGGSYGSRTVDIRDMDRRTIEGG